MSTDNLLIDGLKSGDSAAINTFIDKYGQYIYAVVYNVCGTKQDTEEATQDVFIKVIRSIDKFDFSCNIKTWMYTIAKRTAIDYRRRVKHSSDIDTVFDMQSGDFTDDLVQEQDDKRLIHQMLTSLKPQERELIELYYLKELSNAEISEITGLSVSNIKVKLFRARQQLSTHYKKKVTYEI